MTIYDPKTGIYDHQTARFASNDDTLLDLDLAEARKALFEKIDVKEGGRLKKAVVLDAILEKLTAMAAQGDVTANKLRHLLSEHHQKQEDLAQANIAYSQSPIRAKQMAFKPMRNFANNLSTLIALQMISDIMKAFEKVHGPIQFSASHFPFYLDPGPVLRALMLRKRREKKTQAKQDYDIGRGKTSISTRFTSTKNPRGKSQPLTIAERLKKFQKKDVLITTATGKQTRVTRRAAAYRQTFRRAISGKKGSLKEAITTILLLDKKCMLSPPEKARRVSNRVADISAEQRNLRKIAEVTIAPFIKRDLIAIFSRKHGAIPDFITDYEKRLPRIESIEGWARVKTELAQRQKLKQQEHKIASSDKRVTEIVVVPSRPRARTR